MFPIRDHNPSGIFPFVTMTLIGVTAVVFYMQLTAIDPDAFMYQYAMVPSTVDRTDPSTFIQFVTSIFLHGGWLHFLSNMWFLWIFGDNVEAAFGAIRYFLFYILCGVIAGLVQYYFLPVSDIPTIGASGAIAGVLGAYMSLYPNHRVDTIIPLGFFITRTQIPAGVMLFYWFIIQLFSGFGSMSATSGGGVAWWAHIGGFAAGWVLTRLFTRRPEV